LLVPVLLLVRVQFPLIAQEEPDTGVPAEIPEPEIETVPKGFFSFFSLSLGTSVLFFPESDALRSDPMPILPSPHLALGFPFAFPGSTEISLEASLDVYMTHYTYHSALQRPVPAAIENRSSFVIGPMAGLHFQGKTAIGPVVLARYFLGMAFDLRIVLIAEDLNEQDFAIASNNTTLTKEYFESENRWIFPTAGIGLDFKTAPTFSFGIDGRVWAPLNKLFSGGNWSGFDDWRFGIGFQVTFMHETPDKVMKRDIGLIKKKYAVEANDYAFVLYHLSKNPPFHGIEPARLADEIAKAYRHSGLYAEARAGLSAGKIINMFADIPLVGNDYSYEPTGDVIRKK
jgi:hypothetical protein